MSFEYEIARRYLTQKKETGFITLISYISIAGLTIGVAALILTLGVLNGFERSIKEKVIRFQSHLRLETRDGKGITRYSAVLDTLDRSQEVAAYSAFIEQQCLLRFGRQMDGVFVRGILPEEIRSVIDVEELIKEGSFDLAANDQGMFGIIIGSDFAERFDMSTGDLVVLSSPPGAGTGRLGRPSIRQYEIRGIFDTGFFEFDNLFLFIHFTEAQSYFKMPDTISGIDIKLHDIETADIFAEKLTARLGGYPLYTRTWFDLNKTLFDWMRAQQLPVLIAFGMIILVGGINLISTLFLIIYEKRRDIGILKSMGARSGSIMLIFFQISFIVGIFSTILGSLLAIMLSWIQNTYQIISLNKDVYYINELPIDLDWSIFIEIGIIANILCIAATFYPAWKASKSLPSEAVRQI
ncbi:FtsX-like permease family protein [candidate division KSB1 bacterium]